MRKTIYSIIALAAACISCSTDEPAAPVIDNKSFFEQPLSATRSVDEALEIASRATSMLTYGGTASLPESRGLGRAIDFATPVYTVRNQMSRSNRQDTLMYVINYTDDNGFAMISASRRFPEILAVTESGHFNPEEGTDNPGLSIWYDNMISTLSSDEVWILDTLGIYNRIPLPGFRSRTDVDTLWVKKVPNHIEVKWGQSSSSNFCEGLECPNGVAGCANIATAMTMSYLERPSSIELTYKTGMPTIDLNWTELKRYCTVYKSYLDTNPISDYPINTSLSQLIRELGKRANSDYSEPDRTGTTHSNMLKCLNALSISSDRTWLDGDCSYTGMINYNNAVVMISGYNKTGIGHVWLCDGMLAYRIRSKYYDSEDGGLTWKLVDTHTTNQYTYMNYNWGWYGKANGYYVYGDYNARTNNNNESVDEHNYLSYHKSLIIKK